MVDAREAVRGLSVLVGEWDVEVVHQFSPSTVVRGHTSFEWLEGETFLIVRSRVDHPDFPDAIQIVGGTDDLRSHYFDSRGVARIYETSLAGGVWKMWRDTPDFSPLDFSQRFAGTLSDDGDMIDGLWEISHDGATWENDLRITYRRTTES
jgi:hypothetical protein